MPALLLDLFISLHESYIILIIIHHIRSAYSYFEQKQLLPIWRQLFSEFDDPFQPCDEHQRVRLFNQEISVLNAGSTRLTYLPHPHLLSSESFTFIPDIPRRGIDLNFFYLALNQ